MKCAVTGGSGFIGSHLVSSLLAEGHEVAVMDTRPPLEDVEWIQHDIRQELGSLLKGFDFVFHLAALANARRASEFPHIAHSINVLGTLNVVRACLEAQVQRLLLASTAWVAGSQTDQIVEESTPFNLLDVNTIYGSTKITQEMICYSCKSELGGPDYTILRYGIPYGERMWKGLVVRAFMYMADRSGRMDIMGDGRQYRDFLYVGDLCQAHIAAFQPIAANKVYYLTGNSPVTVEELATEVARHMPARIEYIPQARVEPKLKRIKNDLVKAELGWTPTTSLADGIGRCVNWWRTLSPEEKEQDYWI